MVLVFWLVGLVALVYLACYFIDFFPEFQRNRSRVMAQSGLYFYLSVFYCVIVRCFSVLMSFMLVYVFVYGVVLYGRVLYFRSR